MGPVHDDPVCDSCLRGICCQATDGCLNNKPCYDLLVCLNVNDDCSNEPNEQACYQKRCGQYYTRDAIARLQSLSDCYGNECGVQCDSGGPTNDCSRLKQTFGEPVCDGCVKDACCDPIQACLSLRGCDELRTCVEQNPGCDGTQYPERCYKQQCGQWFTPEAMDRVNELRGCRGSMCGAECEAPPPPWCDPGQCPSYPGAKPCCLPPDGRCGMDRGDGRGCREGGDWCEPDICPNTGRGAPCCVTGDGPCGTDRGDGRGCVVGPTPG